LVAAGVVFVVATVVPGLGTLGGFVQAGAEAAMVGGLADWFAVTALFRHPLGLPIPHTALVPRKKDELATKLGEFVTGYFLTPEVLVSQVAESDLVSRLGRWLAEPARSEQVADGVAVLLRSLLEGLDVDVVVDQILELAHRAQARRSVAPALGRLLAAAADAGAPRPLVVAVVGCARRYLERNGDRLRPTVKRFVEDRHWIAALLTTDRTIDRLLADAARELELIERLPEHPVHAALLDVVRSVAADLASDPATRAEVDRVVTELLDDPRVAAAVRELVTGGLGSLQAALADPHGRLGARFMAFVAQLGRRAVDDAGFHARIESALESAVGAVVSRYGHEVTSLIRRQVEGWPAQAASRRIELAVGRDLQFIRINGTVVGAAAGLLIHAVALALT
jgi:uncharacterized membrane-anchored protein YjiN (DUF445 family)